MLDFEKYKPLHGCVVLFCLWACMSVQFSSLTLNITIYLDLCLHEKLLIYSYCVSVADRMCRSGAIDLICIDSVSALTPRAEIEVFPSLIFLLR